MPDKRISELVALVSFSDTDKFEVAQGSVSKYCTYLQLRTTFALASHIHGVGDISGLGALALSSIVTTALLLDTAVTTAKLADGAVTNGKIVDRAAVSVMGRAGNTIGPVADIAAGANGQYLTRQGDAVGFAAILAADLPAHATRHQSGGADPIKLDDLATPDDNVDLNSSAARHGLLAKLSGIATQFMDGSGAWSTPSGFTQEQIEDFIGALLLDTATIDLVYDDTTPSISANVKTDSVLYSHIQNVSATDRLLGRQTAGAGDIEEITCTAAGRALIDDADAAAQRTTLGLGLLAVKNTAATADIDNDAVTYAKLQNLVANNSVLGRISGAGGNAEELTLTQVLDMLSTVQGVLPYRGAASWAALGVGVAGQVLQSGGAGANPSWAATSGMSLLATTEHTATGTHTFNANAKIVIALVFGCGGGGGSGDKRAGGVARFGGAGGGGGGFEYGMFPASILGASIAVTIGVAGVGAPKTTVNSTAGSNGGNGGKCSFGDFLEAYGGAGGVGGTAGATEVGGGGGSSMAAATAQTGAGPSLAVGGVETFGGANGGAVGAVGAKSKGGGAGGAGGGTNAATAAAGGVSLRAGSGAGAGGGISVANVERAGGAGGGKVGASGGGGTGGTAGGGNGAAGANSALVGGAGGGGGGGRHNGGAAGDGGVGGTPGGGGGGGGSGTNGSGDSGAGGAGGPGRVYVYEYG